MNKKEYINQQIKELKNVENFLLFTSEGTVFKSIGGVKQSLKPSFILNIRKVADVLEADYFSALNNKLEENDNEIVG